MSGRSLAFDIGGSSVKVALVDGGAEPRIAGLPLAPIALQTRDVDELRRVVPAATTAALERVGAIDRVAISTTGVVSADGTVIYSGSIAGYAGTRWAELFEQSFPGRFDAVHVANDGDCAAWAEFVAGRGRSTGALAHFVLGTGLGGGAVVADALVTDPPGGRGNFGHVAVPAPEPLRCVACGRTRCAEDFAATRGVVRNAPCPAQTIRELSACLVRGDRDAAYAFATAGEWLGHAIAAVVHMLRIETVTVGGGLALAARTSGGNVYVDAARTTARKLTAGPVRVLESRLGNDAGLLGAAALAARAVADGRRAA